jgi:erythromycin esterase-like protein
MKNIVFALLALSPLLACNRPTENVETTTTGTTPASDQDIDEMAAERERQTRRALQGQDTLQRGGDTGAVGR